MSESLLKSARLTIAALRPTALAALIAIGAALTACGGGGGGDGSSSNGNGIGTPVRAVPNAGDQWTLVSAPEAGMDATLLAQAVSTLPEASVHGLSSMLVARHGKPVLEQYWNGYDKDMLHDLRSATKSITSLLMGVAIDQRLIGGVDATLGSFLGAQYPDVRAHQLALKLEDMLTMRSGLACDDWTASSPGNENTMYKQRDWVRFYMDLPAAAAPGTAASYCTGNPVALGRVLAVASKQTVPAFAEVSLFGPLNIRGVQWASFDNGTQTDTGGHLQMRPRDMMKLGQLVLQNGAWEGRQLVSAQWIAQSTRRHANFAGTSVRNGYGYLWWRSVEQVNGKPYELIFADGNGGQYIFIVPELGIVAVFTGENYNSGKSRLPFEILDNYILAAVK